MKAFTDAMGVAVGKHSLENVNVNVSKPVLVSKGGHLIAGPIAQCVARQRQQDQYWEGLADQVVKQLITPEGRVKRNVDIVVAPTE